MTDARVDILLSTFNGERYLEQQLASIAAQSERSWRLIVRDDGSRDDTQKILKAFAMRDSRVVISETSGENLGIVASFLTLLSESSAPRFAFCDQDDEWHPDKLSLHIQALNELDGSTPSLVYGDLRLVDGEMQDLDQSFMQHQRFLESRRATWPCSLMQNAVVGCNSMGNAVLREEVLSLPRTSWQQLIMHDWWMAMIASRFGEARFVANETVRYRQHGSNQVGAKGGGPSRYLKAIVHESPLSKVSGYLEGIAEQAELFLVTYSSQLSPEDHELLEQLRSIRHHHGPARGYRLLRCYRRGARMMSGDRDWIVLFASLFG